MGARAVIGRRSEEWYLRATRVMPGGVSSPVRSFGAVDGQPPFIIQGRGPYVLDADGRTFVDYLGSWGALILGHAHPEIVHAAVAAVQDGSTFGATTPYEVEFAEVLSRAVPSLQMVRFVCSGTEAVMSALRLARAATGREIIVKFDGGYHGHVDALLVRAGSGATTLGMPSSQGVPGEVIGRTISLPYNDPETVREVFTERGDEIAAVIVEPVAGNMGVVPPHPGFLEALQDLTSRSGALLIFDEVITAFRLTYGGYQNLLGIHADLTCLGKIIGGGFPLAAYGGRAELMQHVAPTGPVYQAGTLAGNPVAVRAGLAVLHLLREGEVYRHLEGLASSLQDGLLDAATDAGIPIQVNRVGSMLTLFFSDEPVTDYSTALRARPKQFAEFFHSMLAQGIYLPPSQFEAMFLSTTHDDALITRTISAAEEALRTIRA